MVVFCYLNLKKSKEYVTGSLYKGMSLGHEVTNLFLVKTFVQCRIFDKTVEYQQSVAKECTNKSYHKSKSRL